jgi:hypothetical protein
MRAIPAITFADSILQTASIVRCASGSVMACNQTSERGLCKSVSQVYDGASSISSSRVGHTSIVASGALGKREAIPIASCMSAASIR